MLISIDGLRAAPEAAKISAFDRGLLFGDAIYEVVCTLARRPFQLTEHLDRLERSGRAIGLDVRPLRAPLQSEVADLCRECGGTGELYIRIMVTRGASPDLELLAADTAPVRIVMVKPLAPWDPDLVTRGLRLLSVQPDAIVGRLAPWVKSNNRQANVMAHRLAQEQGCHDGLFVDPAGNITEGPTWNVFRVKDDQVQTPTLDGGILPGITRQGIPTVERPISLAEARASDEMFITSTTRRLMPVAQLDGAVVGPGTPPGPVTRRLIAAFAELVAAGGW
jgi:branched-subunit amino acid aminotransferase/4-amino-4-deoxychorismate lyase